jgi:DNA polymerase-3 subunit gamma/tau
MSYQVVARKWRPQKFGDVIGQDHITETLKFAITKDRIAPVYLFTGIRGTGKTSLARIMVKSLNCLDPAGDGEPCNKCENCLEIMENRSPDIVEIDGASNNSVDDVRNIKENITYSPVKSKYKVYIIDEVHMLSKSAFNALLKTLEEPPSHALFVLATTDPQKIPTTVLSRCQRYDLRRLSIEDVAKQLAKILDSEKIEYDIESLYSIAREGEGSMRDSQTILEQLVTFGDGKINDNEVAAILGNSDKSVLRSIIESISSNDPQKALGMVRDIYKNGKSVEKAFRDILQMLHHIVLYSQLENDSFIEAPEEEKKWIRECSAKASTPDWIRLFRFWNDEYEKIKISEFALMVFEISVITACGFPTMADFKMIAKNISEVAVAEKKKSEPIVEKEIPKEFVQPEKKEHEPEPEPETQPIPLEWKSFAEHMKKTDTFFSGALVNLPYEENDQKITLSININLELAKKDILSRLKSEFDRFFKGQKTLKVNLEEDAGLSIYSEKEIERNNEIEARKNKIKESPAMKEAEQMGFSLKKINVE